ncbi:hypothetical protein RZS08_27530, partial [Arthrospira platensis SPKY1]|nr:hypothetical protein [Arthrospira platensis SPKY1]
MHVAAREFVLGLIAHGEDAVRRVFQPFVAVALAGLGAVEETGGAAGVAEPDGVLAGRRIPATEFVAVLLAP